MPSKMHARTNERPDAKQRSPKPAAGKLGILASRQAPLATLAHGGGSASGFLSPLDVLHLQRAIGNQATNQFLTRVAESQALTQDETSNSRRKNTETRSPADGIQRLTKPSMVQMVKNHGSDLLKDPPEEDRLPNDKEQKIIGTAIEIAVEWIDELLKTPKGSACIYCVFRANANKAEDTFKSMKIVLEGWKNNIYSRVRVSGWLGYFKRKANTEGQGAGSIITLPVNLVQSGAWDLASTLIHESSHGAGGDAIIDKAPIGTSGFRAMGENDRLKNAYHFEAAAMAYASKDFEDYMAKNLDSQSRGGDDNLTMVEEALRQVGEMVMNARVHSENMLKIMVGRARKDQSLLLWGMWYLVKPMSLQSEKSWLPSPDMQAKDIEKVAGIVHSIISIYELMSNLQRVEPGGPTDGLTENNPLVIQEKVLRVFSPPRSKLQHTEAEWRNRILELLIRQTQVTPEMVNKLSLLYYQVRKSHRGF